MAKAGPERRPPPAVDLVGHDLHVRKRTEVPLDLRLRAVRAAIVYEHQLQLIDGLQRSAHLEQSAGKLGKTRLLVVAGNDQGDLHRRVHPRTPSTMRPA